MDKIEQLKKIIDESDNIVFFGGAGTSTDCGIKDFRSSDGLYKQKYEKAPEYYLSVGCFYKETTVFFDFYKTNMNCLSAEPSSLHKYLTKLEESGKLKAIVTQNIDGLHQKADSKNVIEIHGTVYNNHCILCNKEYNADYVFNSNGIPKCPCGGIIKPDVVLYGEMLGENYAQAQYYIYKAETLIVAGTSLVVEPACSIIKVFNGKNLIIINNDSTQYDDMASLVIHDNIKNVFEKIYK